MRDAKQKGMFIQVIEQYLIFIYSQGSTLQGLFNKQYMFLHRSVQILIR